MKQSWTKRVRALESAAVPQRPTVPLESMPMFEVARRVLFTIQEGVRAKEEIDEAGASLDAECHSTLTERLEGARRVAAALASSGSPMVTGTPLGDLVASVGSLKTEGEPA